MIQLTVKVRAMQSCLCEEYISYYKQMLNGKPLLFEEKDIALYIVKLVICCGLVCVHIQPNWIRALKFQIKIVEEPCYIYIYSKKGFDLQLLASAKNKNRGTRNRRN